MPPAPRTGGRRRWPDGPLPRPRGQPPRPQPRPRHRHRRQVGERSAKEFADYRRKQPTPYMAVLRFTPADGGTANPDRRMLTDEELERAKAEGKEERVE